MTGYTVALYIRLSSADEDKDGESNSVKNQRDLLDHYIATHETFAGSNILHFVDDGFSGTNFNRPAVKEMIEKAKTGEINCIIVKDFSRFGRNYIEVGDYLDRYFPFLGIRFISVNDRYDSNNNIGNTVGLEVAFKTFIHSLYSRDLSQKTRSGRKAKAEKGVHMCMIAPYGYVKSKTEKNKLLIDEQVAPVIRRIFDMALSGMRIVDMAAILNAEKIDTPLVYRKKCGSDKGRGWNVKCENNLWTIANVSRVLHDERYTGKLVSGKRTQVAPFNKKTKPVPKEDWIIAENAHEAIISPEIFAEVKKLLRVSKKNSTEKIKRPFAGKLYCGYCGYALMYYPAIKPYYHCNANKSGYSVKRCFDDRIYMADIEQAVLAAVKTQIDFSLNIKSTMEQQTKTVKSVLDDKSVQISKLSARLSFLKSRKTELFKEYADKQLSKDRYIMLKEDCQHEAKQVERQIAEFESRANASLSSADTHNFFSMVERLNAMTEVTAEMLSLIERINVFEGNRIEIRFSFADMVERISSLLVNEKKD